MLAREEWSLPKVQPVDVFSLESLIAWLEKMPGDKTYCFLDTGGCLFHQYLRASGLPVHSVGGDCYRAESRGDDIALPEPLPNIAASQPHTFGAALARARSALDCKLSSPERG